MTADSCINQRSNRATRQVKELLDVTNAVLVHDAATLVSRERLYWSVRGEPVEP